MTHCERTFTFSVFDAQDKILNLCMQSLTNEKFAINFKSISTPSNNRLVFLAEKSMNLIHYKSFAEVTILAFDLYYKINILIYSKTFAFPQNKLHDSIIRNVENHLRTNLNEYTEKKQNLSVITQNQNSNEHNSVNTISTALLTCSYCTSSFVQPDDFKCPNCGAPI